MQILKVTDTTTRGEIAAMMLTLRAAYLRGPRGRDWEDRHHARLDALLDSWCEAGE